MVLTVPILPIVSSTIVLGKAPPGVVSSLLSFLQERKISVRPWLIIMFFSLVIYFYGDKGTKHFLISNKKCKARGRVGNERMRK